MADDGIRRLESALVVLSREEEGGVLVAVLESEVRGIKFEALGLDGDGPFLQDVDGGRHYMDESHAFAVMEADGQAVVTLVELSMTSQDRTQYLLDPGLCATPPGMGAP